MSWDDDQPPYSMIGVQTTLPTDPNKRYPKSRPIGFIWPKNTEKTRKKSYGRQKGNARK